MSVFVIKIIACISMLLDHVKYGVPIANNFATRYLGRIAFPLFAFLITEGYAHTSNLKKYYKRLILFALISQVPFMLFRSIVGEWKMLNIMVTLLLGLTTITVFDKIKKKYLSIPIVILLIGLGAILRVDYSWFGVTTVFLFYIFRNKPIIRSVMFAILIGAYYIDKKMYLLETTEFVKYYICTLLPAMMLVFYNGKEGRKIKYFNYWFYPVHLLIIYGLSFICK